MAYPWQPASTSYAPQQWGASEVWPPDAQATGAAPASNPSAYAGFQAGAVMGQGYAHAPYPQQHQQQFHQQSMYGQAVTHYPPHQPPHPVAGWGFSHQPGTDPALIHQHHQQQQHLHHPHWQYHGHPMPQHQHQHPFPHPISEHHVPYPTPTNPAPESASASNTDPSSRPLQRSSIGSSPQPPAPGKQPSPTAVDAARVFRKPGRLTRPARFVVVLRGLPGTGKSYLAKALRDVEVMNGGDPPRVFALDDYFTAEDDDDEEEEEVVRRGSKRAAAKPGTKERERMPKTRYKFDAAKEDAYRSSMLKAFRKALEEQRFTFLIVDDRHTRVSEFEPFWAAAKRQGYEAYIAEADAGTAKDLASKNVHGFTEEQIEKMAATWEPTPAHMLTLDSSSLFHQDSLRQGDITEVEMDADDTERDLEVAVEAQPKDAGDGAADEAPGKAPEEDRSGVGGGDGDGGKAAVSGRGEGSTSGGSGEDGKGAKRKGGALEGIPEGEADGDVGAGPKKRARKGVGKSIKWADVEGEKELAKGFRISTASLALTRRPGEAPTPTLVIGPGPGYNLVTNPLQGEHLGDVGWLVGGHGGRGGGQRGWSMAAEGRQRLQKEQRAEGDLLRDALKKREARGLSSLWEDE